MHVCAVVKYPPIQGGVSARSYWIARALAMRGHKVHVVTNAGEVEDDYRLWIPPEDRDLVQASFPGGGAVDVVSTGQDSRRLAHIPQSTPYVTKLAALAAEQIRRHGCEVAFTYYFEPYGIAAHLAATWTGVPLVVQHAGSDRGRLMSHPDTATAYREMLRRAELIITSDRSFAGLGIEAARLARVPGGFLPDGCFTPDGPVLDVDALLAATKGHHFVRTTAALPVGVPVLGVLGKVGEAKGTYDLIAALSRLAVEGPDFALLAMVGGTDRKRFLAAVETAGLGGRTWTLPLIPHWRVGEFLRACTAVCFLERDFPIAAHTPTVPREIMASGVCAVLSREIAAKQPWPIRHGVHAVVVEDPTDIAELTGALAAVLEGRLDARRVGATGAAAVVARGTDQLGRAYEEVLERAVGRYRKPAAPVAVTEFLAEHAPATSRLLAAEIADTGVPTSADAAPAAAYEVIDALWQLHANDPVLRVIGYERDLVWLAVDLESLAGVPMFPRSPVSLPPDDRTTVLVRTNWMRIARHPGDVDVAVRAALAGDPIDCREAPVPYLFHKRGDLSKRVFRISEATVALIDLCDGSRTVDDVARLLDATDTAEREQAERAIRQLVREQVLAIRPGDPRSQGEPAGAVSG